MGTECYYLYDLGRELVVLAKRIQSEPQLTGDEFQSGRRFAVYEVLSIMKEQAVAFNMTEAQIGLEGIDIESLLK